MSQTGVEHLLQTGMSEPSQTRVQRRSTSILLTFLSCLLNCTFPRAIKLLGNIAFIFRRGNLCPSDGPSLMKPFLSHLFVFRVYALSQSIMFPKFYILETAQIHFFIFVFNHRRGLTGWVFSSSDWFPGFMAPSSYLFYFSITLRRHIWEITEDITKWWGRSSVYRLEETRIRGFIWTKWSSND